MNGDEKNRQTKILLFGKIDKTDKPMERLTKIKERRLKLPISEMRKRALLLTFRK